MLVAVSAKKISPFAVYLPYILNWENLSFSERHISFAKTSVLAYVAYAGNATYFIEACNMFLYRGIAFVIL